MVQFLRKSRPAVLLILVPALLLVCSCNRARQKGNELAGRAQEKLAQKSKSLIDKVLPQFDPYTADTQYNKQRFREMLQIGLPADVHHIYGYAEDIGIDATYQLAFNCSPATAEKIITTLQLTRDTLMLQAGAGMQREFDWWSLKKIESLPLYSAKGAHEYYRYFWYDKQEQKGYYLDFDL